MVVLHTITNGAERSLKRDTMRRVLRFEVTAPGSGEPAHQYTQRWKAVTEARRLEEEHGWDTVVRPVMVPLPINPWLGR